MAVSEDVNRVATRVLGGDDSIAAARALEDALLAADLPGTESLLESLARYGHGDSDPYAHAEEVRALLLDTLEYLNGRVTRVELSRRPEAWFFTLFDDAEEVAAGQLPVHTRDFATAREALVGRLRRDYPRILSLRWSATGDDVWLGRLPAQRV